jgi:hypothetical protein
MDLYLLSARPIGDLSLRSRRGVNIEFGTQNVLLCMQWRWCVRGIQTRRVGREDVGASLPEAAATDHSL